MEAVFLKLLNMSITASYLVLAVILARLLLKKAPKFITVILWGLVAVRLICPFSIESVLSLVPSGETVPSDIMYTKTPQITSGISSVNTAVNNIILPAVAPDTTYSANPLQIIVPIAAIGWLIGIAVMLLYTIISYIRIRLKVREAVQSDGNIYECDRIDTPFILGIIKPRIYLPSAMSDADREYVIAHECAHIVRRDHLWKPLGFLLLAVYWFNPVLWVAYILLCRDIELACDERVIKQMGEQSKKPYSDALINCSVPRKMVAACPLAFGETGVKGRIKSVLSYKKPAFWVIIAAVILSVAVAVCFMTNPNGKKITDIPDNFVFCDAMFDDVEALKIITDDNQYVIDYKKDIEQIIDQLKKVRVRKDEISKSRSENRDKTNSIIFETYTLYFNEDFTEIWGIDGLKPSFSYKILNTNTVKKVFDIATSISKANVDATGKSLLTVTDLQYGSVAQGVSVTLKDYNLICDEPYIEFEFTNEWDTGFVVGGSFELFYYQDGEKIDCVPQKSGWIASPKKAESSIRLEANETKTYKYNLKGYDLSHVGSYRFESSAWVEFELKNQTSIVNTDITAEESYIQFYDKPTDENQTPIIKKQVIFNSSDFAELLDLLKSQKWVDDRLVDRLAHNYDGRIFYNGEWIYFGYSQKIIYYDTYFCSANTQILEIIAKYEDSDLIYGTSAEQLEHLKKEYPDYFGLDTSNGLELYVSEFAEDHYKCELFSVSDYNFAHSDFDINTENGATLEEMKIILSSYDISSDKLYVLPYRNPLSSYYYEIDDAYIEKLKLLFGSTAISPYKPNEATFTSASNEDLNFKATVLKVYDNGVLLVEPFDYEEEYKSADQIAVTVENIVKYGSTSLKEGDKVRIVYDGIILESYPAQITAEAAYLLEDTEK